MVVSGTVALRGVVISSCTYRTISLGSTRTVRFGCRSWVIFALPWNHRQPYVWGACGGIPGAAHAVRNAVKLAGMTDDLLLLIFASAAVAGGYKIWQISLDARAAA